MAIGKLAVRSSDDSWSAGVQWEQIAESFRIRLTDPLGQVLLQLEGDPQRVEMRTAEGEVTEASSPDALIRQQTGWRVPVAGLRYWSLGRPAPQVAVDGYRLDAAGRLAELHQSGWHIRYERYQEFDGIALPTKLTFENPRLAAKLIVRSWTLGPDST
jgi:outer membrane lipoprotein LolB